MTIRDKAVPNIVGVDIGCGMLTANIGKGEIDFEKLDAAAHYIPSGMNVWEGRKERFDLESLRCYSDLKRTKWLERSLGTLGGGNHFIEVDEATDGTKYLVIHTGIEDILVIDGDIVVWRKIAICKENSLQIRSYNILYKWKSK